MVRRLRRPATPSTVRLAATATANAAPLTCVTFSLVSKRWNPDDRHTITCAGSRRGAVPLDAHGTLAGEPDARMTVALVGGHSADRREGFGRRRRERLGEHGADRLGRVVAHSVHDPALPACEVNPGDAPAEATKIDERGAPVHGRGFVRELLAVGVVEPVDEPARPV